MNWKELDFAEKAIVVVAVWATAVLTLGILFGHRGC